MVIHICKYFGYFFLKNGIYMDPKEVKKEVEVVNEGVKMAVE